MRMIRAFIRKLLGIRSPSAAWHGYEFEYDWLKAQKETKSSYVYTVNNKQGKTIDFWIMNQPTPKQATHIISTRYLRVIKPKGERLKKTLESELEEVIRNEYQHN